MQPDVSFIIAAYNAEATIERAIRSALGQEHVSVEVVVIDDRSADRTRDTVAGIADPRVHLVALEANRGPGGARNAGLDVATGRWIAILDADDRVHADRTARLISLAEREDAAIVLDNLEIAHEVSGEARVMFEPGVLAGIPALSLAQYVAGNIPFKSTFNFGYMKPLLERSLIEQHRIRYDESLRIGEDFLFLAAALARGGRCAVEPLPGYLYSITDGSISRVLELNHVLGMMEGDERFLGVHRLDSSARAAFARRWRGLQDARSFLSMVQHIKDRSMLKALNEAVRNPVALGYLRMPIAARLQAAAARFAS